MSPLVSIVVPVFDGMPHLVALTESLLGQTYPHLEIVFSEGGGSDGSGGAGRHASGAGGSGIVIIRYPDTNVAATSTTGSPTITVTGGYRIYTWTSSGSITF